MYKNFQFILCEKFTHNTRAQYNHHIFLNHHIYAMPFLLFQKETSLFFMLYFGACVDCSSFHHLFLCCTLAFFILLVFYYFILHFSSFIFFKTFCEILMYIYIIWMSWKFQMKNKVVQGRFKKFKIKIT